MPNPLKGRIQFIDALRAYAILMMLQGHFTDTLLAPAFRDESNVIFATWKFMRGMTAPIFFTVTGIIFVFLLLKDSRPLLENHRVIKGIRRGFFLIFIAYVLRTHLGGLLKLEIYPSGIAADVLHIIGISLLALIGLFAVADRLRLPYPALLGAAGLTLFFFTPTLKAMDWSFLPRVLENYFTQKHGSVFILFPWIGYPMLGGVIGWHVHRYRDWYRSRWWPGVVLALGIAITFLSTPVFYALYNLTGWENFHQHAISNSIAWRFGQVTIVVSIFMFLEVFLKRFPPLFLKVGTETLTIYGVHYVLLYGSLIGIGLKTFWYNSLDPIACVLGAATFLVAHIVLIAHIEKIRALPLRAKTEWLPFLVSRLTYLLRIVRIVGRRRVRRLALQVRAWAPVLRLQRRSMEEV